MPADQGRRGRRPQPQSLDSGFEAREGATAPDDYLAGGSAATTSDRRLPSGLTFELLGALSLLVNMYVLSSPCACLANSAVGIAAAKGVRSAVLTGM